MEKKIRIGIIGFGKVGKIRYNILKKIKSVEIVSICEKNSIKNIDNKIITTNSFKKFLESNIDAAFICTYNKYLSSYTKALIQKKKHVFCEKFDNCFCVFCLDVLLLASGLKSLIRALIISPSF